MDRPVVSVAVTVAGEALVLRPERAVYWPATRTLFAADLHWGKTETFRAHGIPLPDGVLDDDLARLATALEATGATRLLLLGDLLHHRVGVTAKLTERIVRWRRDYPCAVTLLRGNHDTVKPPASWHMEVIDDELCEGPFAFRHIPEEKRGSKRGPYVFGGHVHPTVTLRSRGDRLRLPCYHLTPTVGILPAFSAFTGGPSVRKGKGERVFAVWETHVVEV